MTVDPIALSIDGLANYYLEMSQKEPAASWRARYEAVIAVKTLCELSPSRLEVKGKDFGDVLFKDSSGRTFRADLMSLSMLGVT